MKKVFLVLFAAASLVACDNSATDDKKDAVDSSASEMKDKVDSSAEAKKDMIDSSADKMKEGIDKMDSANKAMKDSTKK